MIWGLDVGQRISSIGAVGQGVGRASNRGGECSGGMRQRINSMVSVSEKVWGVADDFSGEGVGGGEGMRGCVGCGAEDQSSCLLVPPTLPCPAPAMPCPPCSPLPSTSLKTLTSTSPSPFHFALPCPSPALPLPWSAVDTDACSHLSHRWGAGKGGRTRGGTQRAAWGGIRCEGWLKCSF